MEKSSQFLEMAKGEDDFEFNICVCNCDGHMDNTLMKPSS
jgi:hypothetical protein